jgi:tellurite methyltransferase
MPFSIKYNDGIMPEASHGTQDQPSDRDRWNAKFLAGEAQLPEPDPLLAEACNGLVPGDALDLGGGAGRHAIWLALRGWRAVLADVSDEGLALASRKATATGISLTLRRESAAETVSWARQPGSPRFGLVCVFLFLVREEFPALPSLLAPGGRLVYKTYTADHPRFQQGHSLRYALDPGELAQAFPALETVLSREEDGIAELVARAR